MIFVRGLSVVSCVVQKLLAFRANVDVARTADGVTPLMIAVENGYKDIVSVRILDVIECKVHSS